MVGAASRSGESQSLRAYPIGADAAQAHLIHSGASSNACPDASASEQALVGMPELQAEVRRRCGRRDLIHCEATPRSSNGMTRSARIWKLFRPLPAIRTASPGVAIPRAV